MCSGPRNGLCGCRKSATQIRVTDSLKKLRARSLLPLGSASRRALRKFARRHLDTRAWSKMSMHVCVCVRRAIYWRKTISFRFISSIAGDVRSRRVVSRCQWRWVHRAPKDRRTETERMSERACQPSEALSFHRYNTLVASSFAILPLSSLVAGVLMSPKCTNLTASTSHSLLLTPHSPFAHSAENFHLGIETKLKPAHSPRTRTRAHTHTHSRTTGLAASEAKEKRDGHPVDTRTQTYINTNRKFPSV